MTELMYFIMLYRTLLSFDLLYDSDDELGEVLLLCVLDGRVSQHIPYKVTL